MVKKKNLTIYGAVVVVLISIASFTLYKVLTQGASDLVKMVGINNFYVSAGLIVSGSLLLILVIKFLFMRNISMWMTIKDIFKL